MICIMYPVPIVSSRVSIDQDSAVSWTTRCIIDFDTSLKSRGQFHFVQTRKQGVSFPPLISFSFSLSPSLPSTMYTIPIHIYAYHSHLYVLIHNPDSILPIPRSLSVFPMSKNPGACEGQYNIPSLYVCMHTQQEENPKP